MSPSTTSILFHSHSHSHSHRHHHFPPGAFSGRLERLGLFRREPIRPIRPRAKHEPEPEPEPPPTRGRGDANLTIRKCKDTCYRNSYSYAGVEQGNQCWCSDYLNDVEVGRRFGASLAQNQSDWKVPCSGEPTAFCGGKGFVNAFMAEDNDENAVLETLPPQITSAVSTSTLISGSSSSSTSSGARRNMALFWR
ncbi:unnamed protein product [Sordaria macrospora k-hell]|uniref:WGS project CABT00000000 data, contig 2.75 n=1 Tax=Sordaria macrospora (strain ATCC MYA-333 / DSM 997 / K(L3346) / K-hell) TaxID=771870 RepID=F7WBF5_SORMK|nr:uncharacterized protein SMAC_09177 [Sordaria macrospora k-hell]CCC05427.1 unnamed protein product [Sordaria macrospora k-hell]